MPLPFQHILGWGRRTLIQGRHTLTQFRSGDRVVTGEWFSIKALPVVVLHRSLWKSAIPSTNFYVLLGLAAIIATLGLFANSAATIIGAMIVAPLMGPILGVAFAIVRANRLLLRQSLIAIATGIGLTLLISMVLCWLLGLETLTDEIRGRTQPTLIDLGVALAAGAAGAFARSREDIADALAGVAIAVALVPPLSVVGIGLALQLTTVWTGALLLFLTNLVGIICSGSLVFLLGRYGSMQRARRGIRLTVSALVVLGIPLALSFQNLILTERIRSEISTLLRRETLTFSDRDIRQLSVQRQRREVLVFLEVSAPAESITEVQVELVRKFLARSLAKEVVLDVTVIPAEKFKAPASPIGSTQRLK